ncbi:MAG TPA: hypothetical protein VLA83_02335 [Candidatus Binatia bacterium]|nr:hypothetical protein [Candidatus Binatia bacterium]
MLVAAPLFLPASAIPLGSAEKGAGHPYINPDLGFTYTPPGGLRDLTEAAKADDSANYHVGGVRFESLLRMFSGPDDQAADWVSLGIATLPRGRDKDKGDDITAGFFTNKALGGGTTTKREVVKIAGREFSVSSFEKKESRVTKYAIVYTVVHKEKFISFFFSGNDREKVQRLAKSMDSLKFRP